MTVDNPGPTAFEKSCIAVLNVLPYSNEVLDLGNPGLTFSNLKHRGYDITINELEEILAHLHRIRAVDFKLSTRGFPNLDVVFYRTGNGPNAEATNAGVTHFVGDGCDPGHNFPSVEQNPDHDHTYNEGCEYPPYPLGRPPRRRL